MLKEFPGTDRLTDTTHGLNYKDILSYQTTNEIKEMWQNATQLEYKGFAVRNREIQIF